MPTYLTPGVYFETVDVSRQAVTAIRTDIAAFVGIAERGPLGVPVRVNSWEQFQSTFGSFIPNGYLAYSTKAFFENGGQTCYIVRVAAVPQTVTNAHVPQPNDGSSSLVLSVEGFHPGAMVIVRQGASLEKDHLLQDVNVGERRFIWEQALEADFVLNDPERPLRFSTGAMPARATLLDTTGKPTLRIEASSPGAWGNALAVHVTRSSPAATRTTSAPQPVDRKGSIVESIVGFGAGSLVKAFQTGTPDLLSYLIVTGVDAAHNLLKWKQPLDVGYDLTRPTSFETVEFALTVYLEGHLREHFSGLSLVKADEPNDDNEDHKRRYVEDAVNGPLFFDAEKRAKFPASHFIRVKNLESPSPLPDSLPDPDAPNLSRGTLRLESGGDGIALLQPEDFMGEAGAADKRGVRTLEDVDEVSIVAVPDILIRPVPPVTTAPLPQPEPNPCLPGQPEPPVAEPPPPKSFEPVPDFSVEQIFFVQQALVEHCEAQRDRIALLEPPVLSRSWVVSDNPPVVVEESAAMEVGEIQSWRQRFDSKYAAIYYPWILVSDPLRLGNQVVRPIPPSGHVAGIFARTDRTVGVHKAPANEELEWAQGVSVEVTPELQGLLNPPGINVMRVFPGRGIRLYGARTVSSDPSWRYVNVRRLLMMIEESVEESVQWSVFEPNDFYLRRTLVLAISSFLQSLWERGALVGKSAEEAFFVKCDDENNPPRVADLGQVIVDVGVAPVVPTEFVVFRIGKTEGELTVTE